MAWKDSLARQARSRVHLPVAALVSAGSGVALWTGPWRGVDQGGGGKALVRSRARTHTHTHTHTQTRACQLSSLGLRVIQTRRRRLCSPCAVPTHQHLQALLEGTPVRGAWVAQSVKRPTSAQVMISRFVGSSPALGSVRTAGSPEAASDPVSPSLSAPPPLVLCFSLSLKNK